MIFNMITNIQMNNQQNLWMTNKNLTKNGLFLKDKNDSYLPSQNYV